MVNPILESMSRVAREEYGAISEILPDGSIRIWMPEVELKKCPACNRYI